MGCKIDIKTNSLQGKAIQFYTKQGFKNIGKILDESSLTQSNTKKIKDSSRLLSMLDNVSSLFKKHGLVMFNKDNNIARRNADLFENLVDQKRLIARINEKANFGHNVIGTNKFNNEYWLVKTDNRFAEEFTFEQHQKRSQNILNKNIAYIDKVNTRFKALTGREAITLQHTAKGVRVIINDSVLRDFNSVSYTHYINSMMHYLNEGESVEEDLYISPLISELEIEKNELFKDKQRLNSSGVKKSVINDLDNSIEVINKKLTSLENSASLEDVWDQAEDDFESIDKLLEKDISPAEFSAAMRKLNLWIQAGDLNTDVHMFLDEEELENEYYVEKFSEDIRPKAETRLNKLMKKGEALLENIVNDNITTPDGKRLDLKQILSLKNKINLYHKNTQSLNRVGQALAQYIHKTVNEANSRAFIESKTVSRDLAKLFRDLKATGFDTDLFYQKNSDNVRTGRMIHKFSNKFFASIRKGIKPLLNKYRKEMLFLSPQKLFESNEADTLEYKKSLEYHLGVRGAETYINRAREKYDEYREIRDEFIRSEFGGKVETEEQKDLMDEWIRDNSPIQRIAALSQSTTKYTKDVRGKDTFVVSVPKRFNAKGEETGWYDTSFDQVEANESAYGFYQIAEDITKTAQASFGTAEFSSASLAFIGKSLIDKYHDSGISEFLTKDVYNELVKNITTTEATETVVDPLTGKPVKAIKTNLNSMDAMVRNEFKKLKEQVNLEHVRNGTVLTTTEEKELWAQASDKVFASSKDNIFMSLNMMNLASLSMKHKNNIEDNVNLAMTYLPNSTVETGNRYVDSAGNPVGKKYIDSMKEMVDYFLDMSYYNEGHVDKSSVLFKAKTREEKDREKEIRKTLSNPDLTDKQKLNLQQELNQMGSNVTSNIIAKRMMDYIRLKGLGWNIPASFANLVYGKLTNIFKATDGRLFGLKDLGKAERFIITDNKKFNHTVENYSILGDILFEFKENNKFEEEKNWFFKAIKSLKPYALQTGTEKHNQGTVMIAMMLKANVTNKNGETKSMWEAISDEGVLSEEWSFRNRKGKDAVVEMVSMIKSQVEEIHGDYSNPIMLKNSIVGQALGMFKLWFFEAVHARVGSERPDYIKGLTTKGRYRTLIGTILKTKGMVWKARAMYKKGEMSEVDYANMKVNFIEIATMITAMVMYHLTEAAMCGETKSCKSANASQLTALNMLKRLSNELTFYMNPVMWKNFINNPTAAANILTDMTGLVKIVAQSLDEDEDNDIIQRGINKDRYKFNVWVEKQVPFINQIKRLEKYSGELLNL